LKLIIKNINISKYTKQCLNGEKMKKKCSNSTMQKNYAKTTKAIGSTDMGIPPFNQKVKNLHKLSAVASDRKKVKGTDKYS
jgi:hypothetical protein